MLKKDQKIPHAPEVNVRVRRFVGVPVMVRANVRVDQRLQVVAGPAQRKRNNIRADAVLVIGVARQVVAALVLRIRGQIIARTLKHIRLIVDAVAIRIKRTDPRIQPKIFIRKGLPRRHGRHLPEVKVQHARQKQHHSREKHYPNDLQNPPLAAVGRNLHLTYLLFF